MIIGLKNAVSDAGSAVLLKGDSRSELYNSKARVTRTPTLDLGVVIDSQGYAVGDRVLKIVSSLDESKAEAVWNLYKDSLFLLVSTRDGIFYGSVQDIKLDGGNLEMTFLVKE